MSHHPLILKDSFYPVLLSLLIPTKQHISDTSASFDYLIILLTKCLIPWNNSVPFYYSIWQYLVEITEKEKVAVIITTHYIEECRQAHRIGLMREGRLLAEESPSRLLTLFGTDSLEEVFLVLSKRQEEGKLEEIENLADDDNNSVIHSVMDSTTSIPMLELGNMSSTAVRTFL